MIRKATAYDILDLKKIWDSCFNDPINYIDFVFDKLATPNEAVVYEENGVIVSMLLLINTRLVFGNEIAEAVYILGAATAKPYQNQGYMTYLLEYAENLTKQNGVQLAVLVPGEQYLFGYYKKRGYSADFNVRKAKIKPGMVEAASVLDEAPIIDRASPNIIYVIREDALKDQPHIQWSVDKIKILMEDSFIYGDHIAVYSGSMGQAYAFYRVEGRKLFIKECLASDEGVQIALLKALMKEYRSKSAVLTLPTRSSLFALEGETVPYGMSKPLYIKSNIGDLDPYMNLMFD